VKGSKAQMQRRQNRKGKEPKALVAITVTWHEPEATAAGEVAETVLARSGLRVFLLHLTFELL